MYVCVCHYTKLLRSYISEEVVLQTFSHSAAHSVDGVRKYFQLKVKIATLKESANKLLTQVHDSLLVVYTYIQCVTYVRIF